MKMPMIALAAAAMLTMFAGHASGQTALKDVAEIRNGIITVGIAYEIGERCDSISARQLRGLNFLYSLRTRALELGYTRAQVDAYVDDSAEQDRLEGLARRTLRQMGAREGDPASFCAVGRAEMAKGSGVGNLLR